LRVGALADGDSAAASWRLNRAAALSSAARSVADEQHQQIHLRAPDDRERSEQVRPSETGPRENPEGRATRVGYGRDAMSC